MMAAVRALWVITLAACSELVPGLPDATISGPDASQAMLFLDPEVLLDFGDVSTDIETHSEATVRAADATLVIDSIELAAGSSEKWRIEADDALFTGLAPGESAAIRVYFRPCPDAWSGDRIDPSYDFSLCYGRVAAGSLELSSNAGRRSLSLAGRGAEPPPLLMVEPQDSLQFRWSSAVLDLSWVWLNVTNLGHAPLHIDEIEIVQEQDNWFLETCQSPCRLDATICSYHDPACDVPVLSLPVLFFPPSGSIGELIVRSNDPIS